MTAKSGSPLMKARVPSSGSTTQSRWACARSAESEGDAATASSPRVGTPGRDVGQRIGQQLLAFVIRDGDYIVSALLQHVTSGQRAKSGNNRPICCIPHCLRDLITRWQARAVLKGTDSVGWVEVQVVAYTGSRGKYVAMASIELCHTYQLTKNSWTLLRQLLVGSFPLGVTEDDFYNALGGIHAVARGESGVLLAHGSVVPRRMFHQGRSIRTGYVEAVAVAASNRRQGLGSAIMDSIEHVIAGASEIGALSASRDGAQLYASQGMASMAGHHVRRFTIWRHCPHAGRRRFDSGAGDHSHPRPGR